MNTADPSQLGEQRGCSDDEKPPETFNRPIDGAHACSAHGHCDAKANIHQLPEEVIAYIFEIYIDNHNSHHLRATLLLGAVSVTWCRISQSYPQLWDRFYFTLKPHTTEAQIQLAIEWFNRSGVRRLSVTLSIDVAVAWNKQRLIFPLIEVVNRSLTRCRSLSLSELSSLTLSRFTLMQGPNILENLELHYVDIDPSFDLGLQAAPIKLSIDDVNPNSLSINWTNLTHFRASGLYVNDIVESLILAPQMKVCQQYRVLSGNFTPLDGVVVHSQLECLEYKASAYGDTDIGDFFENIALPGLIEFRVKTHDFPVPIFLQFLARSSCSIKTLSIDSLAISGTGLIELAKALPSITSLTLSKSDYDLATAPHFTKLSTRRPFPWTWLSGIRNQYYYDGDTYVTTPGRVNLKSISILHTDYAEPSELGYVSPPDCDVDTWESLSDLMVLKEQISLKLETKLKGDVLVNLFDFWYSQFEPWVGQAPQITQKAF